METPVRLTPSAVTQNPFSEFVEVPSATSQPSDQRTHDYMYRLIVGQLMYDGLRDDGIMLASALGFTEPQPICGPSNELTQLYHATLRETKRLDANASARGISKLDVAWADENLVADADNSSTVPEPPGDKPTAFNEFVNYKPFLTFSHNDACGAAAFSFNGRLLATASVDGHVFVHDVDAVLDDAHRRTLALNQPYNPAYQPNKLFCHFEEQNVEVTSLAFHPDASTGILLTGGVDHSVRTFQLNNCVPDAVVPVSTSIYYDSHYIRHLEFHPAGTHCLIATENPVIRWLNLETNGVHISVHVHDNHSKPITSLSYEKQGSFFASSSKDGSVRVWDGKTLAVMHVTEQAHKGFEVNSVTVSRDGKHMLSSGNNSSAALWAVGYTARPVIDYTLTTSLPFPQPVRTQAVFDCDEKLVALPLLDLQQRRMLVWDSSTGRALESVPLYHNGYVRRICSNPVLPAYTTCSEDGSVAFCAKVLDRI